MLDVRGGVPGDDGGEAVRLALQAVPQVQEDEGRLRRVVLQALRQGVRVPEGAGNVILSEFGQGMMKLTEPSLLVLLSGSPLFHEKDKRRIVLMQI